tara:strand:- start:171 stop:407 length:237 start_codon:yes stop_codon:yes gene_type:complete
MKIESYLETSLIKKILQKTPKIYTKLKSINKKIKEKKYNSRVLEKILDSRENIKVFSNCDSMHKHWHDYSAYSNMIKE